ncbi:hypothetical protein OAT18_03535 [Tenacibaculum sp.]|nr:hypothetical protein [Tenacibaculum sp.]
MNFEEYLLQIGKSSCTAEERLSLYNSWRKKNLRDNQIARRKSQKRVELKFSLEDFNQFKEDSKKLKTSVTAILQEVITKGYGEQMYLMLSHELLETIRIKLTEIATSITQVRFHVDSRTNNQVCQEDIEALQTQFYKLENAYLSFCTPASLEHFFREEQKKNGLFLEHAQMILDAIKTELDVR